MEAPKDEIEKAVAAAWAQELEDPLMARLLDELHRDKTPLEEEAALFEISKQKFLAAGKTALEHRLWRQKDLKLLRLRYLEHLTWTINQDHPRYKHEEEDALAETWPRLHEPKITLEELDTEVTDWYLLKGTDTTFGFSKALEADALDKDTVPQGQTECNDETGEQLINTLTGEKPEEIVARSIEASPEAWRIINAGELEGEELTAEEVRRRIKEKLTFTPREDILKSELNNLQQKASRCHKQNHYPFPLRLCNEKSPYLFEWFAMAKLGKRSRPPKGGNIDNYTGSTYKLIKGSPFGEAASQPSDEHQQEQLRSTT